MKTILVVAACTVALVVVVVYWLKSRTANPQQQGQPPRTESQGATRNTSARTSTPSSNPLMAMRDQMLRGRSSDFGIDAKSEPNQTWGCLMEMGIGKASVTILSLSNGTTSMYISTGGGVIGAGEHESVRSAAKTFIAKAGQDLNKMARTEQFPLPKDGRVRFYVLTEAGVFSSEEEKNTLGEGKSALSPLFCAGQNFLTQIRLAAPNKQQ